MQKKEKSIKAVTNYIEDYFTVKDVEFNGRNVFRALGEIPDNDKLGPFTYSLFAGDSPREKLKIYFTNSTYLNMYNEYYTYAKPLALVARKYMSDVVINMDTDTYHMETELECLAGELYGVGSSVESYPADLRRAVKNRLLEIVEAVRTEKGIALIDIMDVIMQEWEILGKMTRTFKILFDIIELDTDFPNTAAVRIDIVDSIGEIAYDWNRFAEV
ncbi:MAG: hypothetical protein K6G88_08295 [Lachnospiraceae bacterium]|nr:hypothetical protein [Lachnospiraceae bacterium]